jgi:hypothetical protein
MAPKAKTMQRQVATPVAPSIEWLNSYGHGTNPQHIECAKCPGAYFNSFDKFYKHVRFDAMEAFLSVMLRIN